MPNLTMQHPRLGAVGELVRLLQLLSDPDGVKRIIKEIEDTTAQSTEAYGKLLTAQQAHSEREQRVAKLEDEAAQKVQAADEGAAALQVIQNECDHRQELLTRREKALSAAKSALKEREKTHIDAVAALTGREQELGRAQAAVEREKADAVLARENAERETQAAAIEGVRLKDLRDRLSAAARSVAEA